MASDPLSSPACALHEAPDSYRGYLPPSEITAVLQAITAVAEQTGRQALAGHLRAILQDLPAPAAVATPAGPDLAAVIDALLPRIRDDRLHAAISTIRHDPGLGLA